MEKLTVTVKGLCKKPELNGLKGRVVGWNSRSRRQKVKLDDGRAFWILPPNLEPFLDISDTVNVRHKIYEKWVEKHRPDHFFVSHCIYRSNHRSIDRCNKQTKQTQRNVQALRQLAQMKHFE